MIGGTGGRGDVSDPGGTGGRGGADGELGTAVIRHLEIGMGMGSEVRALVDPFYESHGSQGRARDSDVFFLATLGSHLLGCVRFCVEENTPLLRTMMVAEAHRRSGVGRRLLLRFAEYLDQREIHNTFCLPYAHLESFYGLIGFERVADKDRPRFLTERMKLYDRVGGKFICMRRP